MNKILLTVLVFVLFVLAGCSSSEESELEGKSLGLSTHDPTVSKEEPASADIKFSSIMLVFDFESADDVTLTHNGNEFPGTYTLEDTDLTVEVEDGDSSLKILFEDFEETPDEYYSYTGTVAAEKSELNDKGSTQLTLVHQNFASFMTYLFLEES